MKMMSAVDAEPSRSMISLLAMSVMILSRVSFVYPQQTLTSFTARTHAEVVEGSDVENKGLRSGFLFVN